MIRSWFSKLICRSLKHYTLYSTKYSEKWNINKNSTLSQHLLNTWSNPVDLKEVCRESQFNIDYAMSYYFSSVLSHKNFHEMTPISMIRTSDLDGFATCNPDGSLTRSMLTNRRPRILKTLYWENLKKALIWDFNTHIHSSRIPAYIHTSRYLFYRSLMIHYLTYVMEKKLNLTSLFMIVFLSIKIHPITNIYWYHKLLQRY